MYTSSKGVSRKVVCFERLGSGIQTSVRPCLCLVPQHGKLRLCVVVYIHPELLEHELEFWMQVEFRLKCPLTIDDEVLSPKQQPVKHQDAIEVANGAGCEVDADIDEVGCAANVRLSRSEGAVKQEQDVVCNEARGRDEESSDSSVRQSRRLEVRDEGEASSEPLVVNGEAIYRLGRWARLGGRGLNRLQESWIELEPVNL